MLRGIRDDGCPGLRLLERDGEFAICVQVSAPNRAMAEQYCDKWAARLRAKFGDDVFAEGETSLAQATLDALLEKRKLLVAVDEPTAGLDPRERVRLRTLLADMAQDRIILVATHVVSDVESVATKVILLRAGKIVDAAPVPDLIEKHAPGGGLEDVYLNVFGEGDGK